MSSAFTKPLVGTSGAVSGAFSLNVYPSDAVRESSNGLKERFPPRAKAITNSGLAMKFIVSLFPSFLPGKFR